MCFQRHLIFPLYSLDVSMPTRSESNSTTEQHQHDILVFEFAFMHEDHEEEVVNHCLSSATSGARTLVGKDPFKTYISQTLPKSLSHCALYRSPRLGDGATTFFWSDRWIYGNTIQDIALEVVCMVSRRAYSSRTVPQALDNWQWVSDICGPLFLRGLQQYLLLLDTLG
jgi:hypothetical protein